MTELTESISKNNYWGFLWHGFFLALASSFMDIDTIMPSMITEVGGGALHIGLLVTIMLGGSRISQLFFAPYLHNKKFKKGFLLLGINLRVLALAGLASLFFIQDAIDGRVLIWIILAFVSLFSFSGAFANVSYVDMMGKLIRNEQRKSLLSLKQVLSSIGIFISAFIAYQIISIYGIPGSYKLLFIFASLLLLTASLGFWHLREIESTGEPIKHFVDFLRAVKREVRVNEQLRNYLLIISTLGNILCLMAFLVLYAKEHFPAYELQVGNIVLLKVTGSVISGTLLFYFSKRFRYNFLLYLVVILALSIPVIVVLSASNHTVFMSVFLMGGVLLTLYMITISGVLLEISSKQNRAMYAGAVGAGSMIPAGFSILGGWLINTQGFNVFFLAIMVLVLSSLIFIKKLNCKK